jgi:hypothetical protein
MHLCLQVSGDVSYRQRFEKQPRNAHQTDTGLQKSTGATAPHKLRRQSYNQYRQQDFKMDGDHQVALVGASASSLQLRCPRRRVLLPLGMHRSGTSLLTYLLHTLGATLPDEVVGPACGNPLGHWEPRNLVTINDEALRAIDRSWDDPRPIDSAWFRSRDAYRFIERIIVQIGRDFGCAPLILLKDPRICRILPLYLTALDILDIEPLVILQLRPFHEVARSLADRDGFEADLSEFLWLRSIVEAERVSRSCSRVWVTLDQVISDWPSTARRIASTLEINWSEACEEAAWESAPFIKPRLCHATDQLSLRPDVARWLVGSFLGSGAPCNMGSQGMTQWHERASTSYGWPCET